MHSKSMSRPDLAASVAGAWVTVVRRRAVRGGATQVEVSERVSSYTITRTVTSWHNGARTKRVARTVQAAAAATPRAATPAAAAAARPSNAARAAATGAPRAGRNARCCPILFVVSD